MNDFLQGYLTALYDYAHWKDGELHVGTCGRKYKDAKEMAIKEYGDANELNQV